MSNETRKLPTRRGGWWRQGTYCPYIEEVEGADGDLFVSMTGIPVVDDGTWLAPIPGPAVLAALAEYTELLAFVDASGKVTGPLDAAGLDAGLRDAIRAERDGAA